MKTTRPADDGARFDWRTDIPEPRRRALRLWFWSIAAMTFAVLVVGGITRLTQSGLSIVDWKPLMGVIPPLTEAQWLAAFDQYRQFPEYQVRQGMSLAEFQFIFFWEYFHRLLARGIGVVFLVPFIYFWVRGHLNRPLLWRSLALFALGAAQGVMGWLMVASGLVDRPSVSHYRLAAHLSLAFVIFGAAVWMARQLAVGGARPTVPAPAKRLMTRALMVIGALLALQIVWGAFVAGLKAGFASNTFPLMGGRLVPEQLLWLEPAARNFFENPTAVQWVHRVLGTVLGLATLGFFVPIARAKPDPLSRQLNTTFFGLMMAQYLIGVLTLVYVVPVALGVLHQAMAMVIFGVWMAWLHHVRQLDTGAATARPAVEVRAVAAAP